MSTDLPHLPPITSGPAQHLQRDPAQQDPARHPAQHPPQHPAQHPPERPSHGPDPWHGPDTWTGPDIAQWLTLRRNAGDTPADIASVLVETGWNADTAATAALRSLRRSDRHRVLYATLCWSIGLGALGLASGLHQVLSADLDHATRAGAARSFTIATVLLPLAAFCAWSASKLEATSPHAVWSPTRRMWFGTLAASTATVGLIRLVIYVYRMLAAVTGARHAPLTPSDQFQVVVSLAIAVPLFVWSYLEWRRSDIVISGLDEPAS